MTDYAPFPEQELADLAAFHESVANGHPDRSFLRDLHEQRARACRNAIASFTALRERCLTAELERDHGRPGWVS